jgi:hypothetical protein
MKITINYTDKTKFEFDPFPVKDENMRKIRIHVNGEDGEGIWAAFSDEGVKKYDSDVRGETIPAILVNDALAFYPNRSWGLYLPVVLQGGSRPDCDISKIQFGKNPPFCQEAIDAKKKLEENIAKTGYSSSALIASEG